MFSKISSSPFAVAAVLLATLPLALPAAADPSGSVLPTDFGSPHQEAAEELSEFAFLIGHWQCEIDYLQPDWKTRTQGKATWTAYYTQDGFAIMDDFRGGFYDGYLATTFRAYNRREKRWQGYWLDARSGTWSQPLVQEEVDQGLGLRTRTQGRDPEGKVVDIEMIYNFYDIHPDRFRWRQLASLDGGETWRKDTLMIDCKRATALDPTESSAESPTSESSR